jgi:hypothetical protein
LAFPRALIPTVLPRKNISGLLIPYDTRVIIRVS